MIPSDAQEVPRSTVEAVAKICGPHSAAARALADADSSADPSRVVFLSTRGTWLVLKPMVRENKEEA